jgi:hypothetical protein
MAIRGKDQKVNSFKVKHLMAGRKAGTPVPKSSRFKVQSQEQGQA